MANSVMENIPRNVRRNLLATEKKYRQKRDWGDWEYIDLPKGLKPTGWLSQIRKAIKNRVFSVLVRPLPDGVHLAIASLSGERPTWWEAQEIKNTIAGESKQAVEIYPPQNEVVDEADMYHLWVLNNPLPFSIFEQHPTTPTDRRE